MSKFDTNGGYFAPKDYLKVNEGGSHEENPNGGVQIGVDPEGTPNLLEEGEPVYKDYVYSDNISAEREFLEQNHLPGKYEGKLYSKIADDILKEAEERPLDPISRNGLEALLGRLADAQEGQKQAKEQRDLEDELANLSPEELDQLEQMLAQGEQGQMAPEQMPVESAPQGQMMGPAESVMQQPIQGMPMMRYGGKMARKFSGGGDVPPGVQRDPVTGEYYVQSSAPEILSDNVSGTLLFNPETGSAYNPYLGGPNDSIPMLVDEDGNLIDSIDPSVSIAFPGKTQAWVDAQVGPNSIRRQVAEGRDQFLGDAWKMGRSNLLLQFTPVGAGMNVLSMPSDIENEDWGQVAWDAVDAIPFAGKGLQMIGASAPLTRVGKRALEPVGRFLKRIPEGIAEKIGTGWRNFKGGRNAMVEEAKDATRISKEAAEKIYKEAQETASELDKAIAKLRENPDDKLLKESVESLKEKSRKLDADYFKALGETARKKVVEGATKFQKYTIGPLRNHETYNAAVKEAEAAYKAAEAAAEGAAEGSELAIKAEEALKNLERVKGFGNRWIKNGWKRLLWKPVVGLGTGYAIEKAFDVSGREKKEKEAKQNLFEYGGEFNQSNSYPWGGAINDLPNWVNFLDYVRGYDPSRHNGAVSGTYAIDNAFDYGQYRNINELEDSDPYREFTKFILRNSDIPRVREYLKLLDAGTPDDNDVPKLFDENGDLVDNWRQLYYDRRNDKVPGIYHLTPDDDYFYDALREYNRSNGLLVNPSGLVSPYSNGASVRDWIRRGGDYVAPIGGGTNRSVSASSTSSATAMDGNISSVPGSQDSPFLGRYIGQDANGVSEFEDPNELNSSVATASWPGIKDIGPGRVTDPNPPGLIVKPHDIKQIDFGNDDDGDDGINRPGLLPTWPRYAGAIGSGLLGLYNAFQSPDRYKAPRINPQLPEGRINLQNQVYNPIDQNMVANSIIAQGNATNRALRNSGLGASTASAVLAADNNTTGNLGTGFIQTWDANNQRRNAVIAANNQAEAQRAQFDYTVDAARKQILNEAAARNAQNDFLAQRLNYQAEGDKYTAISNQISNGLQALSGIGKENFAMNQINTNPANLGYRQGPNGEIYYFNPLTRKWEETKVGNPTSSAPAKGNPQFTMNLGSPYNNFSNNPLSRYPIDPFMGYRNYNLDKDKKKTK